MRGSKGDLMLPGLVCALPTPSAQTYGTNRGGAAERIGALRPSLETLFNVPTPRESDGSHGIGKDTIDRLVLKLPTATATATDAKASGAAGYSTSSGRHSGTTLTDALLGAASSGRSGRLNPQLSEWVMGLPIGWTDSERSVTESFRSWWRTLSGS